MYIRMSLIWGLYLGLAISAGTQILTWLGLGLTNWFVAVTYIFVILFVGLVLQKIKKANTGKLGFGQAVLTVFLMVVLSRYIFQMYMFIYTNYIDPDWVGNVSVTWSQTMAEADLSIEEIEKNINRFKKSFTPLSMFTIEIVRYGLSQFVLGILVSLVFVFKGRKN